MNKQVELIKAEIERLIKKNECYLDDNLKDYALAQKTGAYSVLNDLLHFINTLPEEPKFRVGDEIIPKNGNESSLTITKVTDTEYYSGDLLVCRIKEQDEWNKILEEPSKVWHDASEPPKEGVDVLFEVDYIFYQSSYNARQEWFRPYYIKDSDGDDKIFLLSEVTRWAYLDELTKL